MLSVSFLFLFQNKFCHIFKARKLNANIDNYADNGISIINEDLFLDVDLDEDELDLESDDISWWQK